jgi:hypothetical protein
MTQNAGDAGSRQALAGLKVTLRLGFLAFMSHLGFFGFCLALAIFSPLTKLQDAILGILGALCILSLIVVGPVAAYRLSRASGSGVAMGIVYAALMLLPLANFIFLWALRGAGRLKLAELQGTQVILRQAVERSHAPSLTECVAEAVTRPEPRATYGRFALGTLIALGICVALTTILLLISFFNDEEGYRILARFFAGFMGLLTLATLIKIALEAFSGSPRNRETPEQAVACYIAMIQQQRWPEAMSCLSWIVTDGRDVLRPAIPEVDLAPAAFSLRSPADLGNYWRDFITGQALRGARRMACEILGVEKTSESSALVRVRFSLELNLATAAIGSEAWKRASVARLLASVPGAGDSAPVPVGNILMFPWPVYRTQGRWYLLQVGFPPSP